MAFSEREWRPMGEAGGALALKLCTLRFFSLPIQPGRPTTQSVLGTRSSTETGLKYLSLSLSLHQVECLDGRACPGERF